MGAASSLLKIYFRQLPISCYYTCYCAITLLLTASTILSAHEVFLIVTHEGRKMHASNPSFGSKNARMYYS